MLRSPIATRASALTALALASVALLAAARAQAEGRGFYEPLELKPKDKEIIEKSGEMEELFRRRGYVVGAGPETALVQRVGAAIVKDAKVDPYIHYRFAVIRSAVPNAFALPDGQIYVHEGLLALLENEAQLAAVLAHESMHVEGHHAILNARQARQKVGGMVALSILLGQIGDLIDIAFEHAIIGYGRDLEAEADRNAVQRVLDAGYDPRQMTRVFDLLDEDPEGEQITRKATWSDHPLNAERKRYTTEILGGLAPRIAEAEKSESGLRVGEEDFAQRVAGAAKDSIELQLEDDRPRAALTLAQRAIRRWPDDPETHYLLGESYRGLDARKPVLEAEQLTKKAKRARLRSYGRTTRQEREKLRRDDPKFSAILEENWKQAEKAYRDALAIDAQHHDSLRGLGLLFEEKGELRDAGHYLTEYVRAAPEALDKEIVLRHVADITARLKAETAGTHS